MSKNQSHVSPIKLMEELTKLLTKIELAADEVIDSRQQIVNLDAKRHKTREASNRLRDRHIKNPRLVRKNWVCLGDMFIALNYNTTKNLILEEQYQLAQEVDKLHNQLKEKVINLKQLEGKPEVNRFQLKPLDKDEILALRTGFKI